MRQLVPQTKCDRCETITDADVDTAVVTIELPGRRKETYAGENCPRCAPELEALLVSALSEYLVRETKSSGRKRDIIAPPSPYVADGEIGKDGYTKAQRSCVKCDYTGPTRSALTQHVRAQHDMTLTEAGLSVTRAEALEAKERLRAHSLA